jgi:hypothetical protein
LNFVELNIGRIHPFPGFANVQSTMRAGARLRTRIQKFEIELADLGLNKGQETIVLKRSKESRWDGGEWIQYKDDENTVRFRNEMERVNDGLAKADIWFEGTTKNGRPVDHTDRFLRRYFNNGSFQQGGRIFGGFWQALSKAERASGLTIDGEDIVTLDYAQMAPRVLYGLAGATPPEGDAYIIPGYEWHREGVKKVFNALRFTDRPPERFPLGTRKLFPDRATIGEVLGLLSEKHRPIAHLFGTGIGFRDMFIESEILVDVLLQLLDQGITALPVHDAVIVAKSKAPIASEVMLAVFYAHTGVEGAVEEEKAD